jgi:chloride channel 3/4/5
MLRTSLVGSSRCSGMSLAHLLPVAGVMRKNLQTVLADSMTVRDVGMYRLRSFIHALTDSIEHLLANSQCRGFPVVSSDEKRTLLGYIERTEMRWVIGVDPFIVILAMRVLTVCLLTDKTAKIQHADAETPCSFVASDDASTTRQRQDPDSDHEGEDVLLTDVSGPAIGVEESVSMVIIEDSATSGGIQFWPWVNQTPLTVSPQLPLEIVMQLFQRMG